MIKYRKGFAASSNYIVESILDDILDKADISSPPLTTETNQWIDALFVNSFKKNIYLLNTSRGKVLNLQCIKNHGTWKS